MGTESHDGFFRNGGYDAVNVRGRTRGLVIELSKVCVEFIVRLAQRENGFTVRSLHIW